MREQRRQLTPQARMLAAQGLRRSLESLPAFIQARRLAGYWACAGEIPLNLALAGLQRRHQQYFLPRLAGERQLAFAGWNPGDDLVTNRYSIPEPTAQADTLPARDLEVVLVPLLAFDDLGNRLGTGGGFYDATFAFLGEGVRPARPLLIGVGYGFQQVERLEPQSWDVPMDAIATDEKLIHCTGHAE